MCGWVFLCCSKAEVLLVCSVSVLSAPASLPMDRAANRPSANIYCVLALTIALILQYRDFRVINAVSTFFFKHTQGYSVTTISMSTFYRVLKDAKLVR